MESLLARALESKLKYWLKSFTREQFKLQGRTVQLCNLDINGEVLHASIGLPPTLLVAQARVGRLELKVPSLSNVQIEPLVVEIDKLDLVLVEKSGFESAAPSDGMQGTSAATKSTSYGFADKIADGMTLRVGTVNLMLETRGGASGHEGAAWTPPLAALTIRNLLLYTTNECWQVVNLKEARDFSNNKKCIFVFKTLEWESLSVDLLPHPDMFTEQLTSSKSDEDGVKRLFFGGERFLDNISGKAYITMHRTEQNNPLGLEVQVHLPEAICSALSEPGLRALLRFMTGIYVCMNRDVNPRSVQSAAEAAGRTMVAVTVEHIFVCIKDADFQLELLLQSLQYTRSSATNGEFTKTMARIAIGGFFLRDTFLHPCCTLVQPGMQCACSEPLPVPNFASEKMWPRIYPLGNQTTTNAAPLLCMYSIRTIPSPSPPTIASQTVVQCQPLKINLQEESCLRIASFLVDGVVVEHGVVTPTTSVDSMYFSLKQLDLAIPVEVAEYGAECQNVFVNNEFTGVRLHAEDFVIIESPSLNFKILDLEKDPACFPLWQGQPIDSSQRRWMMRAMHVSVALQTASHDDVAQGCNELDWSAGLWRCIEMIEPCIEAAMVTGDGLPMVSVPPPGGVVRFGVDCKKLTSNTSIEQLFFVLKMYEHVGKVNDSLVKVTRAQKKAVAPVMLSQTSLTKKGSFGSIMEMAPSDTSVNLVLGCLELKFLESLSGQMQLQVPPLVQISGSGISLKVTHRTLGGAVAIASRLYWKDITVECVETNEFCDSTGLHSPVYGLSVNVSGGAQIVDTDQLQFSSQGRSGMSSPMRPVFWIHNGKCGATPTGCPNENSTRSQLVFLDIDVVNVIPYRPEDAECHSLSIVAKVSGIRLGGGMVYTEGLLHRFGILGPDGGPGEGVRRILKNLSNGPFAKLLKPPPPRAVGTVVQGEVAVDDSEQWELGSPDEIEINLQLQDWMFALEGLEAESEGGAKVSNATSFLRDCCWHSAFECLHVIAKADHNDTNAVTSQGTSTKHPVRRIIVAIEGLEIMKPQFSGNITGQSLKDSSFVDSTGSKGFRTGQSVLSLDRSERSHSGLDVEVLFGLREDEEDADMGMGQWSIKSVKAGTKKPVEAQATKEEVKYLIETFKLEIEAASRIAAGLMQLLQLQGSIGQAAIQQLSSIGSGSLERLITPEKLGRRSSIESVTSVPSYNGNLNHKFSLDSCMLRLEQSVLDSQEICAKLSKKLCEVDSSIGEGDVLHELTSLTQQLNTMQGLFVKFKNAF